MKEILYLFMCLVFTCCSSTNIEKGRQDEIKATNQVQLEADTNFVQTEDMLEEVVREEIEELPFSMDCDSLEVWIGGIMGVQRSDSTHPYPMSRCLSSGYESIVSIKEKFSSSQANGYYKRNEENILSKSSLFIFKVDMKPVFDSNDEFHVFDYVYPMVVKVYEKSNGAYFFVGEKEVASRKELGRLKLNAIHKIAF